MEDIKMQLIAMLGEGFGPSIAEKAEDDGDLAIFFNHDEGAGGEDYLDSLDRTEFVMAIEDHYKIEIPDELAAKFKTINDVATYVDTVTRGALHGAH